MLNIKLALLFYLPIYSFLGQRIIEDEVQLTTLEMVLWAAVISFIGGISAAYRSSIRLNDLLRSGLNTAVMGACLALLSTHWTLEKPALAWLTIGLSGLLSLGGLATIDWVNKLIKDRVTTKMNNETRGPSDS